MLFFFHPHCLNKKYYKNMIIPYLRKIVENNDIITSVGQKWILHRPSCPFTSIQVNPSVVFDSLQYHSVIFGYIRKFSFMMNPSLDPSWHYFTNIQLYSVPFQNPFSLHVNPSIFEVTLHISSHKFIYPSTRTFHLKPFKHPFN